MRLLQIPRRNHPMAIQRSNYKNRGPTYTDLGVATRCSRQCGDQSSITNTVHYLTTGGASLKFVAKKQEFLIPVILILRALSYESQTPPMQERERKLVLTMKKYIDGLCKAIRKIPFFKLVQSCCCRKRGHVFRNLNTPKECLAYLGSRFRNLSQKAESTSDIDVGHYMIRR